MTDPRDPRDAACRECGVEADACCADIGYPCCWVCTVTRVAHMPHIERECSICHRVQPVDVFGNPHAPDICEGCYRAAGVDIWEAGDG